MDKLDKILLQYLPDTGLCARGRRIQADRRDRLKAAIQLHFLAQAVTQRPVPKFSTGGTLSGNLRAVIGEREGPELIIDEMQMEEFATGGVLPKGDHIIGNYSPQAKEHILTEEQLNKIIGGLPTTSNLPGIKIEDVRPSAPNFIKRSI